MSKKMRIQVDHMDSPERVEQLEKIDQLRELGVGEEINLPQVSTSPKQSSDAYIWLSTDARVSLASSRRRSIFGKV